MRNILATALLAACPFVAIAAPGSDYQMIMDSNGSLDYQLTSVSSLDVYPDQLPANDPTLRLQVGKRYEILVVQPIVHPFELMGKGANPILDNVLLAQGENNAPLESDSGIQWNDDGEGTITFTMTQSLADAMVASGKTPGYRCSTHASSMRADITIVPGSGGPSSDPAVVFSTLNSTQWEFVTVPSVFREPVSFEAGGLGINVSKDPAFAFGFWQSRSELSALPAGRHAITFTLSNQAPPAAPDRQPELRFRVFTADNSFSALGVTTQTGGNVSRNSMEIVYTSDGTSPFRVAIDLLAGPDQLGGTTVTSISSTPLN